MHVSYSNFVVKQHSFGRELAVLNTVHCDFLVKINVPVIEDTENFIIEHRHSFSMANLPLKSIEA